MRKVAFGLLASVVLLAGSVVPSYADWHGHVHFGHPVLVGRPVFVGPRVVVGVGVPFVVAPPVVYPVPAPVVVTSAPPVYAQSPQYWYYCQSPSGYYPSVPACPGGWLQVAPQQ